MHSIVANWHQFCRDMGSTETVTKGGSLFVRKTAHFACDFCNCSIVESVPSQQALADLVQISGENGVHNLGLYVLGPVGSFRVSGSPEPRSSVIMVYDSLHRRHANRLKIEVLNPLDVKAFADLVFSAFGYDESNKRESMDSYLEGIRSERVRLMGGYEDGKLVTCAMTHRDKKTCAIELVSTAPEARGKGLATSLVEGVVEDLIDSGMELIWLFANCNSSAFRIYKRIGFCEISDLTTFRIPALREAQSEGAAY